MPGGIRYFTKDPNKKEGRHNTPPKGVYYHRGHGKWSKYSIERDMIKHAKGWKIDPVGVFRGSRKRTKIPQTSDGKLPR